MAYYIPATYSVSSGDDTDFNKFYSDYFSPKFQTAVKDSKAAGGKSLPDTYSPVYGGIPAAPSIEDSQTQALKANLAAFPAAQNLADQINQARWGTYTGRIPGYAGMATQEAGNINYLLGGGTDTEAWARSAAQNVGRGVAGSPFASILTGQNIESERIKKAQQGQQMLQNAWARSVGVPTYDVSGAMLTPEAVYSSDLAKAIYGSAAIPAQAQQAAILNALQGQKIGASSVPKTPGYTPTYTAPKTSEAYNQIAGLLSKYLGNDEPDTRQTTVERALTASPYRETPQVDEFPVFNDWSLSDLNDPFSTGDFTTPPPYEGLDYYSPDLFEQQYLTA